MIAVLVFCLLTLFGEARFAAAAPPSAFELRGIHVGSNDITSADSTTLARAMAVPGVDGVLLVIGWNEIEPTLGHYKWTALDLWIAHADSLGKTVTLSVRVVLGRMGMAGGLR